MNISISEFRTDSSIECISDIVHVDDAATASGWSNALIPIMQSNVSAFGLSFSGEAK